MLLEYDFDTAGPPVPAPIADAGLPGLIVASFSLRLVATAAEEPDVLALKDRLAFHHRPLWTCLAAPA